MSPAQRRRLINHLRDEKADTGLSSVMMGFAFVIFTAPSAIYLLIAIYNQQAN